MSPSPNAAELASPNFVISGLGVRTRFVMAALLFAAGSAIWLLGGAGLVGLAVLAVGHLPLWVRRQTTRPGGVACFDSQVWAPVEDDWLERIRRLEKRGKAWDRSPWDITNALGCFGLLAVVAAVGTLAGLLQALLGEEYLGEFVMPGLVLIVPIWFNGIRTVHHPSQLTKKGAALAIAREAIQGVARGIFDFVPLLALCEGKRGKYPVDARMMLRPAHDDETGFLGVQLQVSINTVQGSEYPYLYAVILGKDEFYVPDDAGLYSATGWTEIAGVKLVFERGEDKGVRFVVIRQYADKQGGWHTEPYVIRTIAAVAMDRAHRAWRYNQQKHAR
jgi:hypothetical protein